MAVPASALWSVFKVSRKVRFRERGDIVVVVSAMSGETNRLIDLANEISQRPLPRNGRVGFDRRTGHDRASCNGINRTWLCGEDYTGGQVRIHTDSAHTKARIQAGDDENMHADLTGRVVIVAGFKGMDDNNNITTLGRGGSDTPQLPWRLR